MDKFVERVRGMIINQSREKAVSKDLNPEKISEIEIFINNNPIEIKQNKKHFTFIEYVSCCGITEKINVVVYLDP